MSTAITKNGKLPDFSLIDPKLWFDAVEEIFSLGDTSDDEKYESVLSHLSIDHLEWLLEDLSEDSTTVDNYSELRQYVLNRIFQDQLEYIKMMELFECGDLKPSIFISHLTVISRDVMPKPIMRMIWLARLPQRIQKILFVAIVKHPEPMEDKSLENLAAVADGVAAYEEYHTYPTIKSKTILRDAPAYIENDPELWFYLLDEAFLLNAVIDEQVKYEHTVSAMRAQDLFTASLFLTDLPNRTTNNQYLNLRERIIKTFNTIQEDKTYRFVFRNMKTLKPSQFLKFLNDMAEKCNNFIPQVLVRTLWVMQLPIEAQAVLFQLMLTSGDSLQDMNMDIVSAVADSVAGSKKKETMKRLIAHLQRPSLDDEEVDMEVFETKYQAACSFQQKIALGHRYCDFMYKFYYDNSPLESVERCIVYDQDYTAKDMFLLGCTCWYHQIYKEEAYRCRPYNYLEEIFFLKYVDSPAMSSQLTLLREIVLLQAYKEVKNAALNKKHYDYELDKYVIVLNIVVA